MNVLEALGQSYKLQRYTYYHDVLSKRRRTCPKVFFLTSNTIIVYDYFVYESIDTIYINGTTLQEIQEFPPKVQLTFKKL